MFFLMQHEVKNSVYELLLFFIEKSGGSLKLFETQDSSLLKMPDNLYENRFSESKYDPLGIPLQFDQGRYSFKYILPQKKCYLI